jgi:hypothetical protein
MGNIESIEIAYTRAKQFIVYDALHTVMLAIVLFLLFLKLFEEAQKNIANNNHRIDIGSYWGQIRIFVIVTFIATASGPIFHLVESIFTDMQTALINGLGGDSSHKAAQVMQDLVARQIAAVEAEGFFSIQTLISSPVAYFGKYILMGIGIFIFKYTYTFFIIARYMWLLLLELVAPIAIVMSIHESTRSYFFTWVKNMLVCYLLIPMFLLADRFANEIAYFFMEDKAWLGETSIIVVICVGIWVKIKMFSVVKSKCSQLF